MSDYDKKLSQLWYHLGQAQTHLDAIKWLLPPRLTIWERIDNFIKKLATKTK
jgi:hypothetical protein